jgi:hypothetical protein
MRHSNMRTSLLAATIAGLIPGLRLDRDHFTGRQDLPDGVQVTPLGVVRGRPEQGSRLDIGIAQPAHALFDITLEPGASLPEDFPYSSLLIRVQKGQMKVVTERGVASGTVGTGKPIGQQGRGPVLSAGDSVELAGGQEALLGPGNGFSLMEGTVKLQAVGRRTAQIQVSVLLSSLDMDDGRCWICPWVMPEPPV